MKTIKELDNEIKELRSMIERTQLKLDGFMKWANYDGPLNEIRGRLSALELKMKAYVGLNEKIIDKMELPSFARGFSMCESTSQQEIIKGFEDWASKLPRQASTNPTTEDVEKAYLDWEDSIEAFNEHPSYTVESLKDFAKFYAKRCGAEPLNIAIGLLRDLADLQNGPPLEQHKKEWEETMEQVYAFLNKYEKQ